MTPYVLTIPATAPSFNDWKTWHWTRQDRERKAFQALVWPLLYEHGNVCPRPLIPPVTLRAVVMRPLERRRDKSNFGAILWKWFEDVLVIRGFLADDTHDLVTSLPPKILVAAVAMTIVTIEEEGA
jgi:hypothetical protein